MVRFISVLFALIIAASLIGCGSSTPTVSSSAPAWVNKGSGYYVGDSGKAFYGVGASTGLTNVQLRRTAAETNARADIARMFKSRIEDLVKIYSRAIQGGQQGGTSEEATTQTVTRALTEMELSGTIIIDHYYDADTKTEFALALLDADGFKSSLEKMKELSAQIKSEVKLNSDKAFEELDTVLQRNK
jgi:hypothetical protein